MPIKPKIQVEKVRADYEAGIACATVTLATIEGSIINTTQADSSGHYAFANVSSGYYKA